MQVTARPRDPLLCRLAGAWAEQRASIVAGAVIAATLAALGVYTGAQLHSPAYRAQMAEPVRRAGAAVAAMGGAPGRPAPVLPAGMPSSRAAAPTTAARAGSVVWVR